MTYLQRAISYTSWHILSAILSAISVHGAPSHPQTLQGEISLQIASAKQTYVEGELIWFDVTLTNLTSSDLTIGEPRLSEALRVAVIDQHGKYVNRGISVFRFRLDSLRLNAGDTIVYAENLAGYQNDFRGLHQGTGERMLVGVYKVQAFLEGVSSNILDITVNPATREELVVAQEINEKLMNWRDSDQAIQEAKSLIKKYPNSPYLADMYNWLVLFLEMSKREDYQSDSLMSTSLEYLEKFHNSGAALHALNYYIEGFKKKLKIGHSKQLSAMEIGMIDFELNRVQKLYPGAAIQNAVEQIKRIKLRQYE